MVRVDPVCTGPLQNSIVMAEPEWFCGGPDVIIIDTAFLDTVCNNTKTCCGDDIIIDVSIRTTLDANRYKHYP